MRLGELLIAIGVVSPQQIESARSRQIIHGGRIGTNLVELSYLSLDQLADALGRQHQTPPALEAHFSQIDRALAAKLSPELAATWHAVPLGRINSSPPQVAIATTTPFSEEVRVQLCAVFESQVIPAIAPEMRLFYWLEQVYGIERPNRFLRVDHRLRTDEGQLVEEGEGEEGVERRVYVHTISETEEIIDTGHLARIAVKRIAVHRSSGEMEVISSPQDTEPFLRTVRRATSRARMAQLVVEMLKLGFDEHLSAGMLLSIREELLVGWKGFIRDEPDKSVEELAIPINSPSFLKGPSTTNESYFGFPSSPASIDQRLWNYLGPPPRAIAVLPVIVNADLACMLYAQSSNKISDEDSQCLASLGRAVSSCLTRLIRNANR